MIHPFTYLLKSGPSVTGFFFYCFASLEVRGDIPIVFIYLSGDSDDNLPFHWTSCIHIPCIPIQIRPGLAQAEGSSSISSPAPFWGGCFYTALHTPVIGLPDLYSVFHFCLIVSVSLPWPYWPLVLRLSVYLLISQNCLFTFGKKLASTGRTLEAPVDVPSVRVGDWNSQNPNNPTQSPLFMLDNFVLVAHALPLNFKQDLCSPAFPRKACQAAVIMHGARVDSGWDLLSLILW